MQILYNDKYEELKDCINLNIKDINLIGTIFNDAE